MVVVVIETDVPPGTVTVGTLPGTVIVIEDVCAALVAVIVPSEKWQKLEQKDVAIAPKACKILDASPTASRAAS